MRLRIKDLREDNDIKQEVLARLLNVRQATYARYETRRNRYLPIYVIKTCRLLQYKC